MTRKRRGRGEGAVYQRTDGLWVASISLGYDGKGHRRRRVVYGNTKVEALGKLRDAEGTQLPTEVKKLTVMQILSAWLEGIKLSCKDTTHDRYTLLVNRQITPYLGEMKLVVLSPLHIERLFADLRKEGESEWTVFHTATVLNTALKTALKKGLILANPFDRVTKPRIPKTESIFWTVAQTKSFLVAAKQDRLFALYVLALATGMREGELLGLHWPDIDFTQGFLTVRRTLVELRGQFKLREPKTSAAIRRIDLPSLAVQALLGHRKAMLVEGQNVKTGLVFCDHNGGFLRRSNLARRSFTKVMDRAGVPKIRFHDLRHTAASILLAAGEHAKVVQERLGHAKIETTLGIYSHVSPGLQAQAARKLDRLLG